MNKILLILLLLVQLPSFGQQKNPDQLLNAVRKKYLGIRDYTVDANIVVDVSFLNMPEKKAKIYYKYPDKLHIETKGFALLPKRAASFDPSSFIGDKFTAVFIRKEKWGGSDIDVIKTIPNDVDNDVILTTFWIDEKKVEIRKMEINTKSGGTFQVNLEYAKLPFDLPQKLVVVFDVKDMNMPKSMNGEMPKKEKSKSGKEDKKGTVTITYSNYLVNKGLSDKLFIDKNK
jgi:outer membrane lipoprotein-sorting protein